MKEELNKSRNEKHCSSPGLASSLLCDLGQIKASLGLHILFNEHVEMNCSMGPPSFIIRWSIAENPYKTDD